jgi:pyridoxamine 5'-phosphate oxidase-like protein
MKWGDFAAAAPGFAELGLVAFREQNLCLVGTLRADGWPRISANEVYFVDGELLLGMMRRSRKSLDLERDPRITVMTPQAEREPKHGDFKLYGTAVDVTDPRLREGYGETIFAAIGWRPEEPYPLWSVDIESAGYITFGKGRRLARWTEAGGVEELRHPDADQPED